MENPNSITIRTYRGMHKRPHHCHSSFSMQVTCVSSGRLKVRFIVLETHKLRIASSCNGIATEHIHVVVRVASS